MDLKNAYMVTEPNIRHIRRVDTQEEKEMVGLLPDCGNLRSVIKNRVAGTPLEQILLDSLSSVLSAKFQAIEIDEEKAGGCPDTVIFRTNGPLPLSKMEGQILQTVAYLTAALTIPRFICTFIIVHRIFDLYAQPLSKSLERISRQHDRRIMLVTGSPALMNTFPSSRYGDVFYVAALKQRNGLTAIVGLSDVPALKERFDAEPLSRLVEGEWLERHINQYFLSREG